MTNRREFLIKSGLAVPALFLRNPTKGLTPQNGFSGHIDWKALRRQFPLSDEQIYLNNGTMGPSPQVVIDAVAQSMRETNSSGNYGGWFDILPELAGFFHAEASELCPTHNVTDGINIIAQGLKLKPGDEIIVSNQEHVGNALPWLTRARRDLLGVKVLDLRLPNEPLLDQLQKLITPRTRVLAIPHIPCTTGRIMPLPEISRVARANGMFVFYDGAHGAGMLNLDLKQIDCDFYATCTHKWMLGPKGTGFLYIRKDKLDTIDPVFTGAYSDAGWNLIDGNPRIEGWAREAKRYFNGTQSPALFAGVKAALDFHRSLGKELICARIKELNDLLWQKLSPLNGIEILTPEDQRAGMLSFRFTGKEYLKFQEFCAGKGIIVRAVPENNVNAIRVSTHIYNQEEEILIFAEVLNQFLHE